MRNRGSLNNFFNRDRKTLYMVLSVLVLSIFTLTIAYAALSTTLNINGQAEITASSWDIYLDNVQLNGGSATTSVPTISNKTTATFSTTLTNPGDYYMFTIDVVNDGSIDAMIDSIEKTPTLTQTQAKYLNYIVEYQNGEAITKKELVQKNSFVRLKVKVEFRKDITTSELPSTSETLNLSFKVNYIQADEVGTSSIDNNGKLLKVVSGDYDTVGSEIAIGNEHFYVISSTSDTITMLAKYNLYVGGVNSNTWKSYGDEATGIQNSTMLGLVPSGRPYNGTNAFSTSKYWPNNIYATYVYDQNSNLYTYVENYKVYLQSLGIMIEEARLIKIEELESLGCSINETNCTSAPSWVSATSYWTGAANGSDFVWRVETNKKFDVTMYMYEGYYGVRPVIKISKS